MRITIIGTGYVGLVTGTCFADLGHDIICLDIRKEVIEKLSRGETHIYEPGLRELVKLNFAEGRLRFTTDYKSAVENSEVIFICVGTPSREDGSADLSAIFAAAKSVAEYMNGYKLIVNKSTAPAGTLHKIKETIRQHMKEEYEFDIVSNPETLREGSAIRDFRNPDRIILGVENERAKRAMITLYKDFERANKPILFLKIPSAEISKYASNAMLASRISFMNELAPLCEKTGADIKEIAIALGLDERIGPRFLQAGAGYGGSCFPKDVKALAASLHEHGFPADFVTAINTVNELTKMRVMDKLKDLVAENLQGKTVSVLGLAFKPRTDDIREAPSLVLIQALLEAGASVKAFDPIAMENTKKVFTDVAYCSSSYDALKDSDAVVLITEWDEFRNLDKNKILELMKNPTVVDARNVWDQEEMTSLGFKYSGVGR